MDPTGKAASHAHPPHSGPESRGDGTAAPPRQPGDLEAVLVPILTRLLESGRGPPGLIAWVARRAEYERLWYRSTWSDAERRLVRRLARDVARSVTRWRSPATARVDSTATRNTVVMSQTVAVTPRR